MNYKFSPTDSLVVTFYTPLPWMKNISESFNATLQLHIV